MQLHEREFFVYRLISNYQRFKLDNTILKILVPSIDVLYEGQEVYIDTLNSAKENGVAGEKEIDELMRDRGLWSDYDENQLVNVLPKHVEYWKTEIYHQFNNSKERIKLELHLDAARRGLIDLFGRKHMFDHYTQHGLATFARWQRIIELSTVNFDGTLYDWEEVTINHVLDFISKNHITETILREVVRTDPWKSMWMAGKKTHNLFLLPSTQLSDEQRRAINWSGLYDSVGEYPDCPNEDVIKHDDAFDGWLIIKNKESEKQRDEESLKKKKGNKNAFDAPEVFIVMSDDDKDNPEKFRNTVYGMNDPTSRMIVQSRLNTVKRLGEAKDTDFADVQRGITRDMNKVVTSRR